MILLLALLLAQQTVTKPGTLAPYAQQIQGCSGASGCTPIPISGTVNSAGVADNVGTTAAFNANSICATVPTAGQTGAGFFLAAGTLTGTVTPSVSTDATPSGTTSCSGGNYTATQFVDISGNKTSSQAFTNPNAFFAAGLVLEAGVRCVRVCTTAFTSGTASGNLVASTPQPPPPAAGADVTDRAGRLLGVISTGANTIGAVTAPGAAALALDASVTGLEVAQGSTTSGQKGVLLQGAVTTAAPTYTTAQTAPLSLDTAGNARVLATPNGTTPIQGLGTPGAPAGGVVTMQGSPSSTPVPISGSVTANAADTIGTQVNLSVVCASGSGCAANSTALVAMAGAQSAGVVFSANAAATMTVVADCSRDGASTWNTAVVNFMTAAGVVSSSIVNPTNTDYFLMVPPGCGAATNVRVRVSAYTSGNINAQLRAVTMPSLLAVSDGAKVPKVEAASTAVAAGDQAWAVSLSPNSPLPVRAATTIPTAAADAAAVPVMSDKFGRLAVTGIDRALVTQGSVITLTTTTETTLIAAGGASVFLDLTYLHCSNTSTTATRVDIRDSTAGTVRDFIMCPAAAGPCEGFKEGLVPFKQTTANNNWTVQLSGAVTDVRCVAQAVQLK